MPQLPPQLGPLLANETAEVLLHNLGIHFSSADIAHAQVRLIAKYISMAKKSIPKEPELIDLEPSDDETVDPSVIIVDLDESDVPEERDVLQISQSVNLLDNDFLDESSNNPNTTINRLSPSSSRDNSSSWSKIVDEEEEKIQNFSDIFIVDSVGNVEKVPKLKSSNTSVDNVSESSCHKKEKGSTKPLVNLGGESMKSSNDNPPTPSKEFCTGGILRKRKRRMEKDHGRSVEVVEILDDDIIVLDDTVLSEAEVLVLEPDDGVNRSDKSPAGEKSSTSPFKPENEVISNAVDSDTSQSTRDLQNVTKSMDSECSRNDSEVAKDPGPPKKKSKLSYHRPAHLVTPLIQPNPAVPSTAANTVTNIYNPNADSVEKRTGLRPIIIDGNNVALGILDVVNVFGSHGKGIFSLKGIKICINYFEKRGHRLIKVFIPQYRKNRETHDELANLERKGIVVITPSRRVNGKVVASYDDRYIVQYAAEFGGVIVSTDNFRDLLIENPSWRETIEKRLLMFTWVDDLLMFPQDPLGRRGPSLDEFLRFPDT